MFSYLKHKRTSLLCCIFACLITFNYTQNCFASSSPDKNQTTVDFSLTKEKKKNGFFNRIIHAVFRQKITAKEIKKNYLSKLNKKLLKIDKRIARVSRQKYNTKHTYRIKHSLTFKSTHLQKILESLSKKKNVIVKQILFVEKEQNLITKNKTIPKLKETVSDNKLQNQQKPTFSVINPIKIVSRNIPTKETFREKRSIAVNIASVTAVKHDKKISRTIIKKLVQKPETKKITFDNTLPYKGAQISDKALSEKQLTNVKEKILLSKTNKAIKFREKTLVLTDDIRDEPTITAPKHVKTLKLKNESAESIVQLDKKIEESSSPINASEIAVMDITSISDRMDEQIREMVVNDNSDEIKMALEDGDSIGVIRVLVIRNISRQDLTLSEKDTINGYISILGEIGNDNEIKFLSEIKAINRKLDNYYTHNIYSSIWKLKKKAGRNRIETRDDFDDAIDYISYVYNYYKTNTNENMELYNYEISFLSEIIEALSHSSFTQESVPSLAKLIEFKNKDFVNFVNETIDNIFSRLDIEISTKMLVDFRP